MSIGRAGVSRKERKTHRGHHAGAHSQSNSIIRAVNRFSNDSNDVALFGKILRNEVDEEFRFIQASVKRTVAELLRVYIKSKNPLKMDEQINEQLKQQMNGYIEEDNWVDIIKYMYNKEDSLALIIMVKDLCRHNPPKKYARRTDGRLVGDVKGRRRGSVIREEREDKDL